MHVRIAKAFRHYQVVYRVVGKGGGMAFDQSYPGLPFPVPKSQRDDVLDRALEEFDLRNIQSNVLANIGIPIQSLDPKNHKGQRTLFQMGKAPACHQLQPLKNLIWPIR